MATSMKARPIGTADSAGGASVPVPDRDRRKRHSRVGDGVLTLEDLAALNSIDSWRLAAASVAISQEQRADAN
jgi:hypothetical protein